MVPEKVCGAARLRRASLTMLRTTPGDGVIESSSVATVSILCSSADAMMPAVGSDGRYSHRRRRCLRVGPRGQRLGLVQRAREPQRVREERAVALGLAGEVEHRVEEPPARRDALLKARGVDTRRVAKGHDLPGALAREVREPEDGYVVPGPRRERAAGSTV